MSPNSSNPPIRSQRRARRSLIAALVLVFAAIAVAGSETDRLSETARYFHALRERGLFVLAEDYAGARLAEQEIPAALRTELTVELSHTLLEHGALLSGREQQELWQAARQQLQALINSTNELPRRRILEGELALQTAREGISLAIDSLGRPEDAAVKRQAIEKLQTAVREITSFLTLVDPAFAGNVPAEFAAPFSDLRQELQFQLANVETQAADLLASGSERAALLVDAAERSEALLRARPESELQRQIKVLQARVARLQGDDARAATLLDAAQKSNLDPHQKDHLLAERMRLERSRGKLDAALQVYADRVRSSGTLSNELRATAVDVLLDAWKLAASKGDKRTEKQLLDEAISQHEQTGGVWRKFTTARLDQLNQDRTLGPELAALVRKAAAEWQSGQGDLAVRDYGEAASIAHRSDHMEQAFDLAYTRGSILLKLERWQGAAQAFEELVKNFPENPQSPQADLLRCYALGRQLGDVPEFQEALQQHLQKFPKASTSGDALWMLGAGAEQNRRLLAAVQNYSQIPAGHPRREDADLRITVLLQQMLDRPNAHEPPAADWDELNARETGRISAQILADTHPRTPLQCRILLNCARLIIERRDHDYRAADQLLQQVAMSLEQAQKSAAKDRQPLDTAWEQIERQLVQLQIVSLACQQHLDRARTILQGYRNSDPARLLAILAGLSDFTSRIDPQRQYDLGYLQRLSVRDLAPRRNELTEDQKRLLDESAAQASMAMGDWEEAISLYEVLLKESPQDRRGLERLIELSLKRGTKEDLQRAKDLWSRIEQQEKPGSTEWIEARLEITDLLLRLGDAAGARKLLGVTRTLYPAMGNASLKSRGSELWAKLR